MSGKETYNKRGMKPLSELTLLDRFLFSCAMEDPRILEEIDFNKLPAAYLITIAPFDLFGEGKYRYTFRMKCEESVRS